MNLLEVKKFCEIKVLFVLDTQLNMSCRFDHLLTKASQLAISKKIP